MGLGGKKDKKASKPPSSSSGSFARPRDDARLLRAKQIDSLRQYFPTVREREAETKFEIPLSLPSHRQIVVLVDLDADFPKVPPQLSIPGESHRFLDAQGRVLPTVTPGLSKWALHSALGRCVYEVVQVFMKSPPEKASTAQPSGGGSSGSASAGAASQLAFPKADSYVNASVGVGIGGSSSNTSDGNGLPIGRSSTHSSHNASSSSSSSNSAAAGGSWQGGMGSIPSSFPELHQKSPAELQRLLSDETAFQQFFDTLAAVQTMKRVRDDLMRGNEELARRNIAIEAEIEAMTRDMGKSGEDVDAKKREYERLVQRQQEVMKRFSSAVLVERLADSAADAEGESDAIADDLLHGEIDQREFIKRFLPVRNLFHLRSAKSESLTMMTKT